MKFIMRLFLVSWIVLLPISLAANTHITASDADIADVNSLEEELDDSVN